MKKIFYAMATIAAALLVSLGSTATAAAETAGAPAPTGTSVAATEVGAQQSCEARFSQGVNHRTSPNTSATIIGIIPAGRWVPAACSISTGSTYTACGATSNYWLRVYWNGRWGYSAWTCASNWQYA